MSSSQRTKLNHVNIKYLLSLFGICDLVEFSILKGGSENTNYYIQTGSGIFTLTVCEDKSFEDFSKLAKLLSFLEKHSFYSSQLVITLKGENLVIHNDKPVMLKKYLAGEIIENFSEQLLVQLGARISELHHLPAPDDVPKSFRYGLESFYQLTEEIIDHPFVKWLSLKSRYLQENIPHDLPKALIHGDLFCDNILVKENRLIAIMDFEEASFYYRMFDIGMAIVGTCIKDHGICFKKAKNLVSSYCNKQLLLTMEKERLQLFAIYGATATAFWRFRQHHIIHKNILLHDRYLEMKILADKIASYPAAKFLELFDN